MTPFRAAQEEDDLSEMQVLVVATAGSAATFVVWLALISVALKRWERRRVVRSVRSNVPDPTPEEILEAQSLGLMMPTGPDPGGSRWRDSR